MRIFLNQEFKVLLKELQSLALDVRVLDQDNNEVRLLESSEYEVTDFKKVLDEGNGYRRNSREEEAEYKAGGMSTVTLNEDGTEDAVDSDDEADFDMADDFDDDYDDDYDDEYDAPTGNTRNLGRSAKKSKKERKSDDYDVDFIDL